MCHRVTHNLNQAKRLSDRVAFIYEGILLCQGARDILKHRPQSFLPTF
ncbi:MAG: hypothetical protein R2880_08700 [Deinococcales bacterium]